MDVGHTKGVGGKGGPVTASEQLQRFQSLVSVAALDGVVHPAERAVLEKFRRRWELPEAETRALLDAPSKEPVRVSKSMELAARLSFFKECAEIVYADGVVSEPERRLLLTLREKLEIPEEMMADLLRPFAREGTTLRPAAPPAQTAAAAAPAPPPFEVYHGSPEERRSSPTPIIVGIVVFLVVAAVGVAWMMRSSARRAEKEAFDPVLGEYLRPVEAPAWIEAMEAGPEDGEEEAPADPPAMTLKFVLLDLEKREVDDLHLDLPETLKARNPDEVGTIVWLSWSEVAVGTYTDGAVGYVQTCRVTLIDKASGAMVWRQTFLGSDPPGVKKHSGPARGSRPNAAVLDFLRRFS